MNILKFFRKKKQVEGPEEKEIVSKDKLFEWFLEKKKEHEEREEDFLNPIKERISQFISELESEIVVLENIDMESKKTEFKIKLIIKENLKNYINYLEKMIVKLKEIDGRDRIVEKINSVVDNFDRKSKISYAKVTFLIGKEMQATKESIRKFLKDLEIILKENSKEFEEFQMVKLLEKDIKELERIKEEDLKAMKELNFCEVKMKKFEEDLKKKKEKIKELKDSDRFEEEKKKEKELESKKKKLEKQFNQLTGLIDFKTLLNFYHKFENEMKLVKEYKDRFKQTLQASGINKLIALLKEAKLNTQNISDLVEEIKANQKEILKISINDLGIGNLEREIEKIDSETKTIESEKSIKKKKLENLDEDSSKLFKELGIKLNKINVSLEMD